MSDPRKDPCLPPPETLSVEIDGADVGGWPLTISRRLWFDFLSAAYGMGIEEHDALDLALRRFIASAQGTEPPPLAYRPH
jgi:hypothetical protein